MSEAEQYSPYTQQEQPDMSYPPYEAQDFIPDHPNLILDREKARFVAYAEKPYQDQARELRDQGNQMFIQAVEQLQEPGKNKEDSLGRERLDTAVSRLRQSEDVRGHADNMGEIAEEIYDQNNK